MFLQRFNSKHLWILVCLLTIPAFVSLMRPGFFPMQDDLQAFRVHQMVRCFFDYQIPCRWVPDAGFQYGYPMFNFYSPSVFYLGAIIHLLGIQIIDTVKFLFILGFLLSSLSMYFLLERLVNKWAGLIGAMFFIYAPFRATQVYVRGALNEFWAMGFFPLLFLFSYKYIKEQKTADGLLFALTLALLFLTHNLLSFIFLPILAVWVLFWIVKQKSSNKIFFLSAYSLLGLGLSSFFVLPLIFERNLVHLESLVGGYFDYRQHFVSIGQLLFSNYFGYGSSVFGLGDEVALSTGILHWVIPILVLVLGAIYFKKNKQLFQLIGFLLVLEFLVLFLMHQRSSFIWEKIPMLLWLQFPWRLLSLSVFLGSILSGLIIYYLPKNTYFVAALVLTGSLFFLHGNFYQPKEWFSLTDQEKFTGQLWEKQLTISIFDYLPIFAKFPPNKKAQTLPEVLSGNVQIEDFKKSSNSQQGKLRVLEPSVIRLQQYDFPGMVVTLNNQIINHTNNDCRFQEYCFGLISFYVTPGEYQMKMQLKDTPIRTFSNMISVISLVLLFTMSFKKKFYAKV